MLRDITILEMFGYLLVFCRMGSAIMVLPGIGEGYVPPRVRLILALTISLIVYMVVKSSLPTFPHHVVQLLVYVIAEIMVGLFIGLLTRLLIGTVHMAGMIIAYQSGMAQAVLFDMNAGVQGSAMGNFMTLMAVMLLFATNLHHILLYGLTNSYTIFPAGAVLPMGDVADYASSIMSSSFDTAILIAGPHIIIGMIAYLGAGVMGRLMPTMQIFFVMIPLQIFVGFFIMMITFSAGMMWYMQYFRETIENLLGKGF